MGGLRRKLVIFGLLAGFMLQTTPEARAGLSDDINKLQLQMQEINRLKQQANNELARVNVEVEEAQVKLGMVDQELAEVRNEFDVLATQVAVTNNDLKKVEGELKEAEAKYQQRKTALAARVRSISEEGRVSYLAVLLGSSNFNDFIGRFDLLRLIVKQDSQLFTQIRADKQALAEQREAVAAKKTQLLALQDRAKEREVVMVSKRVEHEQVSRSLQTRRSSLLNQLDAYDREAEAVSQQVWELQQREKRAGGTFAPIFPVKNYQITDVYGPRLHPILGVWRNHNGTDFAASYGVPVYAIESGTVIVAGWNDAYGNLVVIDHGGGIASWYGHSSRLMVSVGQAVSQGQKISEAGSTGWSTGPHVHLEIHVQGKPVDPMDYLQ